jgi:hypothetical protein
MPYREAPARSLTRLIVNAPVPLTPVTFLPFTVAMSIACRRLEPWAIIAVSSVTVAAIVLSVWSIVLWKRKRNADRVWQTQGGSATEFRFALDAADYRFAQAFGAAIVLAIVVYCAVAVTHPTEALPTPPATR